ncbi:MAG: DUF5320 domain-containing protein [Saccharofermentanales bacterium]
MPRRDGTGPMGQGSMTGRGLGLCIGSNAARTGAGLGLGLGCRRGYGRGYNRSVNVDQTSAMTQKELLQNQRDLLLSRIDVISKQLENL